MTAYTFTAAVIGVVAALMVAASQWVPSVAARPARPESAVPPCDDCPGGPGCYCHSGYTDATDCTCGNPKGDS